MSASFTSAPGSLLLLFVLTNSSATAVTPTSAHGTWALVATQDTVTGGVGKEQLFSCWDAAGHSGGITFATGISAYKYLVVLEYAGSYAGGLRQTCKTAINASYSTLAASFGGGALVGSSLCAAFWPQGSAMSGWTSRTGWSQLLAYSSLTSYVQVDGRSPSGSDAGISVGAAAGSGDITGIGVEVAEAASSVAYAPLPNPGLPTALTTANELAAFANRQSHRLAFVVLFEGVGIACTTTEDVPGISAAWAGSQWASGTAAWYQTAFPPGSFKQEIEFFNPKIPSDGLSFRVQDPDDSLAGQIFGQNRQAARTFLTVDMLPSATALTCQETAGFAGLGSSYSLYIGGETILAVDANRTATGWTGLTRAAFSFHTRASGQAFAPRHSMNTINGSGPRITSAPTTWYNRRVRIYLHHFETGLGWAKYTQALLVWEGVLRNIVDDGDRALVFNAVGAADCLKQNLLENQFTAEVGHGMYLPATAFRINITEVIDGTGASGSFVPSNPTYYIASFGSGPGFYSTDDLITALNAVLPAAISALSYSFAVGRGTDRRVIWSATSPIGTGMTADRIPRTHISVALDPRVWHLLGFDGAGDSGAVEHDQNAVYDLAIRIMGGATIVGTTATFNLIATDAPIIADLSNISALVNEGQQIPLVNVQGSWMVQPILAAAETVPVGTEGYIQIGDLVIKGGSYAPGAAFSVFTVTHDVGDLFYNLGFGGNQSGLGVVREVDSPQPITVKQIWYEKAAVKDVLLRLLLSTGDAAYNNTTYDVNPLGMGIAVPNSLIDLKSFRSLGNETFLLLLNKPTQFSDVLSSMLAIHNRYLVWRQGVLKIVEPKVTGPTIATAYVLSNDNKTKVDDRVQSEQATDGVINRVELRYQRAYDGSFKSTAIFEDVVSSSDFGPRRAVQIDGWGVENNSDGLKVFEDHVAAGALAYFSRPMTKISRTIDKTLILIAPGDTVLVTDPYVLSPRTGKRGITNWPAWAQSVTFDYSKMAGSITVVYNGEMDVDKICGWAPSARVDSFASNAGYVVVDGSTRYIATIPKQYSDTLTNDVEWFDPQDKIIIRELSPADRYAPLLIHATVSSVDVANSRLYLTTTIAGWSTLKQYIVEPDVIATVQQSQLAGTFIADDVTDTTGRLANDAYVLGTTEMTDSPATPNMGQDFMLLPVDGSADGQGHPLAVADLFEAFMSCNSLLAYKTRHIGPCHFDEQGLTSGSTIRTLVAGPFWVPMYSANRALIVRLFVKTDGGSATFYVTSSRTMPSGIGGFQVKFTDTQLHTVSASTSSTTFVWLGPLSLPVVALPGSPPGIWVTVEAFSGSATHGQFAGIGVMEDFVT